MFHETKILLNPEHVEDFDGKGKIAVKTPKKNKVVQQKVKFCEHVDDELTEILDKVESLKLTQSKFTTGVKSSSTLNPENKYKSEKVSTLEEMSRHKPGMKRTNFGGENLVASLFQALTSPFKASIGTIPICESEYSFIANVNRPIIELDRPGLTVLSNASNDVLSGICRSIVHKLDRTGYKDGRFAVEIKKLGING